MMQSFHLPNPVPQSFVYTGTTHWTSSFWLKTLNSAQIIVLHTRKTFESLRRSSSLFPGSLKSWFKEKKKKKTSGLHGLNKTYSATFFYNEHVGCFLHTIFNGRGHK